MGAARGSAEDEAVVRSGAAGTARGTFEDEAVVGSGAKTTSAASEDVAAEAGRFLTSLFVLVFFSSVIFFGFMQAFFDEGFRQLAHSPHLLLIAISARRGSEMLSFYCPGNSSPHTSFAQVQTSPPVTGHLRSVKLCP